tara:strand:- start:37 stop:891 length:855 start_codon:yes stop_codon:yes gene_type:complete
MSTLQVRNIQGLSNFSNEVTLPSGHSLVIDGSLRVPTWNNTTQPSSPSTGLIGYNTEEEALEIYNGTEWQSAGSAKLDGSSPDKASTSGLQLVTDNPTLTSGLYWIKSSSMPNALQMYVDTSYDGGGYDFYATKGSGPSVSYITDTHAGVSLGLEMWEGRSRNCWLAATNAVNSLDSGNFNSYWEGVGHVYKPNGGGNYTGCIMRSSYYGGNNCADWRVKSGNKWWIRDSTHSEPNGDYSGNGFQRIYSGSRPSVGSVSTSMGFNDGGAYSIGNYYLLSTNAKT